MAEEEFRGAGTAFKLVTIIWASAIGSLLLFAIWSWFAHWVFRIRLANLPPDQPTGNVDVEATKPERNSDLVLKPCEDPCRIDFSNLSYWAPNGARILHNISGVIEPGQLVALMGPSGCGKTTALDVLAGRRRQVGHTDGKIIANGKQLRKPKHWIAFQQQSGYMLQLAEAFSASLTVRENLVYAALLRLPSDMEHSERLERVEGCLNALGMQEIADVVVGSSVGGGISGGQKRRLMLAIEMLRRPSVLFLDEPTSGLDSTAALDVVHAMRAISLSGRAVVMTIHQPRASLFAAFDKILLLYNGSVAYYGSPAGSHRYLTLAAAACERLFEETSRATNTRRTEASQSTSCPPLVAEHNLTRSSRESSGTRSSGGIRGKIGMRSGQNCSKSQRHVLSCGAADGGLQNIRLPATGSALPPWKRIAEIRCSNEEAENPADVILDLMNKQSQMPRADRRTFSSSASRSSTLTANEGSSVEVQDEICVGELVVALFALGQPASNLPFAAKPGERTPSPVSTACSTTTGGSTWHARIRVGVRVGVRDVCFSLHELATHLWVIQSRLLASTSWIFYWLNSIMYLPVIALVGTLFFDSDAMNGVVFLNATFNLILWSSSILITPPVFNTIKEMTTSYRYELDAGAVGPFTFWLHVLLHQTSQTFLTVGPFILIYDAMVNEHPTLTTFLYTFSTTMFHVQTFVAAAICFTFVDWWVGTREVLIPSVLTGAWQGFGLVFSGFYVPYSMSGGFQWLMYINPYYRSMSIVALVNLSGRFDRVLHISGFSTGDALEDIAVLAIEWALFWLIGLLALCMDAFKVPLVPPVCTTCLKRASRGESGSDRDARKELVLHQVQAVIYADPSGRVASVMKALAEEAIHEHSLSRLPRSVRSNRLDEETWRSGSVHYARKDFAHRSRALEEESRTSLRELSQHLAAADFARANPSAQQVQACYGNDSVLSRNGRLKGLPTIQSQTSFQ